MTKAHRAAGSLPPPQWVEGKNLKSKKWENSGVEIKTVY